MPVPNEVPIGPVGDLVDRLLTGETVQTGDLATFLILKLRCPEFEICDAWPQRVTHSIRQDHPELASVTERMIMTIRLDVKTFRRRIKDAPEGSTEHSLLAFLISDAQKIATSPLAQWVGPILSSQDLQSMSQSLKIIESIVDRRIRNEEKL